MKPRIKNIVYKLPLEKFIPAALLIFLASFIVLVIIVYNNANYYGEYVSQINHSHEMLSRVDQLTLTLTQLQLSRRGYIVLSDKKYLDDYNENKKSVNQHFIKLKELTNNEPSKFTAIITMDSLAEESISYLDSSIIAFESGRESPGEIQTLYSTKSQGYLGKLILRAAQLKNEELTLLNRAQENANRVLTDTRSFLIYTGLFVLIVLGLSFYISSELIKNKNKAENLLKKSYDELENRVEERTAELRTVNENLSNEVNTRIKAEKSLKESEERFRLMADASPVMIWLSDKNRHHYYFNKTWLNFTGSTTEKEKESSWMKNIHPDDYKKYYKTFVHAFENREPYEVEYRLKNSQNEYRWLLDKGVPRYEGNEFTGFIGCCFDINLRKRNERFARIQYSVSKTLMEHTSVNDALLNVIRIICTDINWNFGILWKVRNNNLIPGSIWSKSSKDYTGYTSFYNKNYRLERGAGLPGSVWERKKSIWVEDISKSDNFIRKEDAVKSGWNSALAVPVSNGREVTAVIECFSENPQSWNEDLVEVLEAVGRQVGNYLERMNVEEKLKESYAELENTVNKRTSDLANAMSKLLAEIESKEKLQSRLKLFAHAVKGIKESVYITDLNNNVIFANSAFEETFGYYEEELIGKKIPFLFSEEIDEKMRMEILVNSLRGGWKGEFKGRRKDNKQIIFYLSISVIRNDEGKVQAYVGICQDITENIYQKNLLIKRNALLKLLNDVIVVTNRSFNVQSSVSYTLNRMCEYTDWDIGHCFLAQDGILVSTKLWNANLSHKFIKFRELTEGSRIKKDEGMPGKCFISGESIWAKMNSISKEPDNGRFLEAVSAGLKTGVWAPIKQDGKVVGVLEFFNKDEKEPDNELLDSINNIGGELGSLFERNETFRVIRDSEQNLRLILENIKDYAIIRTDIQGNIVSWNKGAEEINGYKAHEIIGEHFSIFYTEEEIKQGVPFHNLEKAKNTGTFKNVGWRVRKNGSLYWANVIITALRDENGNLYGYVKVTHDDTERRKSEEALVESERRLREAQKIAMLGSWEQDTVNNSIFWSDEMFRIFETETKFDILNMELLQPFIFDEDLVNTKKSIGEFIKNLNNTMLDFRIVTQDGKLKYLTNEIRTEFDENTRLVRIFGSTQDITDIKVAEDELRRTNTKLIETQKELVHNEKLAALGRFSSGIAHEIRNPLANISALAQLLSKAEIKDEKMKKHLNYILINIDIANDIIRNLLNFASPDELVFKKENIEQLIIHVVNSVESRCNEKNIEIKMNVDIKNPEIQIDKKKLENALFNFISNSIEAMPGGGTLTINALSNHDNKKIMINIIDTGRGISPENIELIFEPFFTTKESGTGLGLGLAYKTISLHKGTLNISSEPGKGTEVLIKLPIRNTDDGKDINS